MADVRYETYTTIEGDMVDDIAFARFGASALSTEAILAANPGLAAYGPRLPGGVAVLIPVPGAKDRQDGVSIWS